MQWNKLTWEREGLRPSGWVGGDPCPPLRAKKGSPEKRLWAAGTRRGLWANSQVCIPKHSAQVNIINGERDQSRFILGVSFLVDLQFPRNCI